MRRLLPLVAVVLLAAGCEDQDAVPTSRSVPVAALQLTVLLAIVAGGWVVLARRRRNRGRPEPAPEPGRWRRRAFAALAVLPAVATLGVALLGVATVAFGYEEPTYQLLSWEETATLVWWFVSVGAAAVLGQLRLAAALVRGDRWALWVLGAELVLIVFPGVLGLVVPA